MEKPNRILECESYLGSNPKFTEKDWNQDWNEEKPMGK